VRWGSDLWEETIGISPGRACSMAMAVGAERTPVRGQSSGRGGAPWRRGTHGGVG
jgi:hypothetical protein